MFNLSDLFNVFGIVFCIALTIFMCLLTCLMICEFIKKTMDKRKLKPISGREYVGKYGECPICVDCPHNCPLDSKTDF